MTEPITIHTWVSLADAATVTGSATLTQAQLNQAQVVIEGYINRVWREGDATARNGAIYWLACAVAFQAQYIAAHPELFEMMSVESIKQEGLAISFKGEIDEWLISPIAKMFVMRLPGASNTTVRPNSAFQRNRAYRGRTSGNSDGLSPWRPL